MNQVHKNKLKKITMNNVKKLLKTRAGRQEIRLNTTKDFLRVVRTLDEIDKEESKADLVKKFEKHPM